MIEVEVIRAWPRRFESQRLDLPDGATVGDALLASGWGAVDGGPVACAVHGLRVDASTALRSGDRVELLRPLLIDPKDARRRRAERVPGR